MYYTTLDWPQCRSAGDQTTPATTHWQTTAATHQSWQAHCVHKEPLHQHQLPPCSDSLAQPASAVEKAGQTTISGKKVFFQQLTQCVIVLALIFKTCFLVMILKCKAYVSVSMIKGEKAETRPPEILNKADFKILYSKNFFFGPHQVI